MCMLPLGENGLEKYRLANIWEQFKIRSIIYEPPGIQGECHP